MIPADAILGTTPKPGIPDLYSEHYLGHEEPHVHSKAIKGRGAWLPGFIDPAAKGRSQVDGTQLIERYRAEGLHVEPAINAVEAGLYKCEQEMHAGRIKAFTSLSQWYSELRSYRRNEKDQVVKERDHCMDAMRYLVMSGLDRLKRQATPPKPEYTYSYPDREQRWMMN
jgi:Terminase RNaseH-like domain